MQILSFSESCTGSGAGDKVDRAFKEGIIEQIYAAAYLDSNAGVRSKALRHCFDWTKAKMRGIEKFCRGWISLVLLDGMFSFGEQFSKNVEYGNEVPEDDMGKEDFPKWSKQQKNWEKENNAS